MKKMEKEPESIFGKGRHCAVGSPCDQSGHSLRDISAPGKDDA